MFYRFRIAFCLALLIAMMLALPVLAGGWAVITLDELPTGVVEGTPLTIGFTVLQHGVTPMNDLDPILNVHLDKTDAFVVHAKHDDKPGHYVATLTFPKEGNWNWSIQAFTMDQAMPALSVAAPIVVSTNETPAKTNPILWLTVVRSSVLVIGLVGLLLAFRRKNRMALGVAAFCLLIGLASFITGASLPVSVEAQSKSSSEMISNSPTQQVELGRQLFIAKGCITCHVNNKVASASEYWTIEMGAPNLSKFSASPEVLRLRLKDPTLVKSDTKMPNLNLADDEIEALVTFINSK